MILAGIDEAGYGPLLGPLVVGCCAFEVEGDPAGPVPCLWKRLRRLVSKKRPRSGKKIHINDSKVVYSPGLGIKQLERSVLALVSSGWADACEGFEPLIHCVAAHVLEDVNGYAWYAPAAQEAFPLDNDGMSMKLMGNALRAEMRKCATRVAHMGARVVLERQFNDMLRDTRNKASTLFSTSAIHLDYLLRTFAPQGLVIFCDRQGGRGHYGALLRQMFDQWSLEVSSEQQSRSEYWLSQGGTRVRIIFCEKAEGICLPVAVASMLSKYLRELLMHRFNSYWKQHLPELEPTAGYYGDGERFLRDIHAKRIELGIGDEEIVRSR